MTDDLSVQQKRPSAMPYVLGGAAVGGAAGYFGTPAIGATRKLVSEPAKYESFDALIEEAKKGDEFLKVIEKAEGDEKTALEKLKNLGKDMEAAEAKWQEEFDAFKAEKMPALDASDPLMQDKVRLEAEKATAEANLKNKIAELEKAEVANLEKAAANTGKTVDTEKAIKALTGKIETAKANTAKSQKELNELITNLAEDLPQGRSQKLKDATRVIKTKIDNIEGISKEQKNKLLKEATEELQVRAGLLDRETIYRNAKEALERELEASTANALKGKKTIAEKVAGIEKLYQSEAKQLDTLTDLQARRKEHIQKAWEARKAAKKAGKQVTKGKVKIGILPEVSGSVTIEKPVKLEPYKKFVDTLTEQERKIMPKAGKKLEAKVQGLQTTTNARKKILDLNADLTRANGALESVGKVKADIVVPQNGKIAGWQKTLDGFKNPTTSTTADDIAAKAKEIVAKNTDKYKAESDAVAKVTGQLDDVLGKIKAKVGSGDESAILEEFTKTKGSKVDAGKKVAEGLKDDVKSLFEGKISNKKLAVAAGIAAAAGIGLALMFRPKAKEQA